MTGPAWHANSEFQKETDWSLSVVCIIEIALLAPRSPSVPATGGIIVLPFSIAIPLGGQSLLFSLLSLHFFL